MGPTLTGQIRDGVLLWVDYSAKCCQKQVEVNSNDSYSHPSHLD